MYRCPNCKLKLELNDRTYKCANKHSFDVASSNYVNLLLANQKHSAMPGDNKESINSRSLFFQKDPYHSLKSTLCDLIDSYANLNVTYFCDLACGQGYYTNYIHTTISKNKKIFTYGVDISQFGILRASKDAKNLNNISYCVANLASLPYLDNSFDIMLNCFAPIYEDEFLRVLKDNGIYIRVLPNKKHLFELKKIIYETPFENEIKDSNITGFNLIDTINVDDKINLSNEDLISLFKMTPYYYKSPIDAINKLNDVSNLNLTLSFIILVYRKA